MPLEIRTKDLIGAFLEELKKDIASEIVAQGRSASGNSIKELEVQANEFRGVLLGSSYMATLETGRKAGKVPKGFAEIIEDWMRAKGIFQSESIKTRGSIAYFIAKKISEQGTLLHRQGGQSGVISKVITDERINAFTESIAQSAQDQVEKEVISKFYGKA